jgi:hypothetical protein
MQVNPMKEEICLVNISTINTIFSEMKYFQTLKKRIENILIITGHDACIVGSEKATIILPSTYWRIRCRCGLDLVYQGDIK